MKTRYWTLRIAVETRDFIDPDSSAFHAHARAAILAALRDGTGTLSGGELRIDDNHFEATLKQLAPDPIPARGAQP